MLFHSDFSDEADAYHNVSAFQMRSAVDLEAFRQAVRDLAVRHPVLRTSFAVGGFGEPLQLVHRAAEIPVEVADLRGLGPAAQEAALAAWFEAEKASKFEWSRPPLLRFGIHLLAKDRIQLGLAEHHAILDGWSVASMLAELFALYSAHLGRGETPAPPPAELAFRHFVALERQALASEETRRWWSARLAGAPVFELPRWAPERQPDSRGRGEAVLRLPRETAAALKVLAEDAGAPLKSVLLAAHLGVLALTAGRPEVVTGVVANGRPELEGGDRLFGLFLNTLPFPFELAPGSWRDLVRAVFAAEREVLPHRRFPLAEMQRLLGGRALFEVMFNYIHFHVLEGLRGSGGVEVVAGKAFAETNFPLAVDFLLEDATGEVEITLKHDLGRIRPAQARAVAERYRRVLQAMAADPDGRHDLAPLLSDAERHQLLSEWNDTRADLAGDLCLHELFREQARQTPGAVALICGERRWTYGELELRVDRLARHLRGLGVGPEVFVGLCAERSAEMVAGMLAILGAGGAYVPLDPAYPKQRLAFMLEDTQAPVLLTQSRLLEELPEHGARVVLLDGFLDAEPPAASGSGEPPLALADPGHLAYAIYTSGSTGRPKGVAIAHRSAAALVHWARRVFSAEELAGVLASTSISFDLSVFEIFATLASGGAVILAENALALPGLPAAAEVTLVNTVPSAMAQLADALPASVRAVNLAGEPLRPQLVERLYERGVARVFDLYGPSEDTTYSTCALRVPGGPATIGRPIADTRLYLVDAALRPVALGAAGELVLGGAGLARGYLRRPELTAERFVPDPFAGEPGARLYRTGDLARHRPDGQVEFLGRLDHQVKVRGFRIELGEIEAALERHPAVREAVVLAREDRPGQKRLAAYLAPVAGAAAPGTEELRRHLLERLPEYMVPAVFVALDALPRLPNGKIDRRGLPAPAAELPVGEDRFEAPRTPAEALLARLWAEVLGVDRVGAQDDFFALGGDSILSIQVVSRAAEAGLRITPRQIFEQRTIAGLAGLAAVAAAGARPQRAEEVEPAAGPLPLTPIQSWFFEQDFAEAHHWNQAVMLEVREPLEPRILRDALARLLAHHDALRLRFARGEEGWRAAVAPAGGEAPFTRFDLSALPEAEQGAALTAAAGEVQASFDLAHGPILRAAHFDLGPQRTSRLCLAIHHLAVDGVSWRILLGDLERLCRQLRAGDRVELGPRTTSCRRWARSLAELAASGPLRAEADVWLAAPPAPLARLPLDGPGGPNTVASAEVVAVSLDAEETRALLREAPAAYRTEINDLLLAALAQTVARRTGARGLVVELEGHGREEIADDLDLSRTVGWFTALYPVVLDLAEVAEPGVALKSVKESLRAVPRRGLGHGMLRFLAGDPETAALLRRAPAAELVFNYLGQFDQTLPASSLFGFAADPAGPGRSPRGRRAHLLEVNALVADGRLQVQWVFSRNRQRRSTVEALAQGFLESLRGLVRHCLSPEAGGYTPSDFPLAGLGQERLDLLLGRQRVEDVYPLSPLQEGLLFHTLYAPGSGIYVEQFAGVLRGDLDAAALRRAWQAVVDRHPVLRSSFHWRDLDEPLQVVHARAELPWEERDWRGLSETERAERLRLLVEGDWRQGFDLERAPLMRCSVVRLAEDAWHFLWSHHHLLLDGWSWPLVLREVFACYEAFRAGAEPALPSPRPYRDHIAWLRRQDLGEAEVFWRRSLAGAAVPTALPLERGAPGGRAGCEERLSAETAAALEAFARRHRLTPSTLVQGAWGLLLARYSGERTVVAGAILSGRESGLAGVESMVGPFINSLPVRLDVDGAEPLPEWLERLQAHLVELRQYEHTPLVQVQRWSGVPPEQPLFETLVVFQNYPVESVLTGQPGGVRVERSEASSRTNYPLTLLVSPGREWGLRLEHLTERCESAAATRLLGHLGVLLRAIAADPQRRLAELPLLTEAERSQLERWNATAVDYRLDVTLHGLIEEQAARTPGAVAVSFDGADLTYDELDRRANQLASALRGLGVGPGSVVGICAERSLELVVGLLGILKAGGAYLPLDPGYPRDRLAFMLEDAGAPVLLVQERLRSLLAHRGAEIVLDGCESFAGEPEERPASGAGPEEAAYVIYTSGSTGRPKGVVNTHRGIVNRLLWMQEAYGLTPADRVLQKTPFSFDVSVWEFFWPLLTGARLVLARPEGHRDSAYLARLISAERVTTLHFVPSMLQVFLEETDLGRCRALKRVICSGEALPKALEDRFFAVFPAVELHNLYGPTEAAVDVTFWRCEPGSKRRSVPIGRPIANTQIHILDAFGSPAPVEVPGELCIGGTNVSRGYLGRSYLTAERFVPDPFLGTPGARLYRTGDLARRLSDGAVDFLGRLDHQIKLRGLRIELGEIEAALESHPLLREAVVVARRDAGGDTRLAAYVVPQRGAAAPSAAELRDHLLASLPEHMVPSAFVPMEGLPLTPSGKADRRALPDPGSLETGGEEAWAPPRTPVQELLAGLWRQVLGVERVGLRDGFFELGGHSLRVTQTLSRVRETFGVELPLRELFEHPALEDFASRVEEALRSSAGLAAPPLVPVPRDGALPLSFAQERLWFLHQVEPGSAVYNVPTAVRLRGALDERALEGAFSATVRRHETLRTTFARAAGRPVQVAAPAVPAAPIPLPRIDLAALPAAAREAELLRLATAEARAPFDLARGPVLRVRLARLAAEEHALLLTLHHIVSDGWSSEVLIREVAAYYAAFRAGEPARLPELAIQYADFAVWQRGWLRGETLDKQIAWWRERLAGVPALELPADRPRPAVPSSRGGLVRRPLPPALLPALEALAQRERATLFMTLLAAFSALLSRYSGQEDLAVGTPIAGRNRRETEDLIGFFVNTLVLRADLAGDPPFRALAARVREAALGAWTQQDVPFERLVQEIQPARDVSRTPLFQVMFAVQPPTAGLGLPGLALAPLEIHSGTAKFDLTLVVRPGEDAPALGAEHSADLFDGATVTRLLAHFQVLLEGIAADPERRVSELPLLSPAERCQILEDWNATAAAYPREASVSELFEAVARELPEAPAIVAGGEVWTYRRLDEASNLLARHLQRLGVRPGAPVGVSLERSAELIVGMLAILKAGGAYVPLDASYPDDRLRFMRSDTGAEIVLVQEWTRVRWEGLGTSARLVEMDGEWREERPGSPGLRVPAESPACVIYTSGSTGRPKGVAVPHRGIVRLVRETDCAQIEAGDRVSHLSNTSFDAATFEIWGPLLNGGAVVVVPKEVALVPADLAALLDRERVTALFLTTALFNQVVREAPGALAGRRLVLFGGEAADPGAVARALEPGAFGQLLHVYGPTESTTFASWHRVEEVPPGAATVPIGIPIANTTLYVLDRRGQPVPPGVAGELFVGGDGLANGYWNRPELTAERFVPHPWSAGERLYRTGDLVRRLPNAAIEFLGRTDDQVKIRGFRIELGEIEAALARHPEVAAALVLLREDEPGDRRLVAYFVARGLAPASADLRAFLRRSLPEPMIPAAWVPLPAFPLTPNGKVDRRALPAPSAARSEDVVYVSPARGWSGESPRSGARRCGSRGSASRTTSSTSAAIRCCCWRSRPGCATCCSAICRSSTSSASRPSPRWPDTWTRARPRRRPSPSRRAARATTSPSSAWPAASRARRASRSSGATCGTASSRSPSSRTRSSPPPASPGTCWPTPPM